MTAVAQGECLTSLTSSLGTYTGTGVRRQILKSGRRLLFAGQVGHGNAQLTIRPGHIPLKFLRFNPNLPATPIGNLGSPGLVLSNGCVVRPLGPESLALCGSERAVSRDSRLLDPHNTAGRCTDHQGRDVTAQFRNKDKCGAAGGTWTDLWDSRQPLMPRRSGSGAQWGAGFARQTVQCGLLGPYRI